MRSTPHAAVSAGARTQTRVSRTAMGRAAGGGGIRGEGAPRSSGASARARCVHPPVQHRASSSQAGPISRVPARGKTRGRLRRRRAPAWCCVLYAHDSGAQASTGNSAPGGFTAPSSMRARRSCLGEAAVLSFPGALRGPRKEARSSLACCASPLDQARWHCYIMARMTTREMGRAVASGGDVSLVREAERSRDGRCPEGAGGRGGRCGRDRQRGPGSVAGARMGRGGRRGGELGGETRNWRPGGERGAAIRG